MLTYCLTMYTRSYQSSTFIAEMCSQQPVLVLFFFCLIINYSSHTMICVWAIAEKNGGRRSYQNKSRGIVLFCWGKNTPIARCRLFSLFPRQFVVNKDIKPLCSSLFNFSKCQKISIRDLWWSGLGAKIHKLAWKLIFAVKNNSQLWFDGNPECDNNHPANS